MNKAKLYHRFSGLSIIAVLVLFFLGGLVRVTGSGMGCPDWPKCFGEWIPPTSEDQLPADYQDQFTKKRKEKVDRLIATLNSIGMSNRAHEIRTTTWLMEPHAFNVGKAYTEYINRVWGALTGIFAVLAMVFSFHFWKTDRLKVVYTFLGLFFVGYNGWLGSIVVDTNLFGGLVTIHFVLAFLALYFFMLGYTKGNVSLAGESVKMKKVLILFAVVVAILQLISGTLVREDVDMFTRTSPLLPIVDLIKGSQGFALHRLLAPVLGLLMLGAWYSDRKRPARKKIRQYYLLATILIGAQIATGTLNIWYSFPVISQLLHIVFGSLLVSGVIYIAIHEFKKTTSPVHA